VRVLVTYGSDRGGTAELAGWIGDGLRAGGAKVEVHPCRDAPPLTDFDAVVIGGSLYSRRWHADARRFVRRHTIALSQLPVWLFSSGPLDDPTEARDAPPVADVQEAMTRTDAREHLVFGGRLSPDAQGFVARKMARNRAGDWRDADEASAWGESIARVLSITEVGSG
jgi:menaquinone-dependent protoporphyrinogen oxidase